MTETWIKVLFALLVIYQFKHLIADYFLQGKYMLGKFNKVGWALPLLAHVGVHGGFTFVIAYAFTALGNSYDPLRMALGLALLDGSVHFAMDKLKVEASRNLDKNKDAGYWHWLGIDQMVHHFTHYYIIYRLILG